VGIAIWLILHEAALRSPLALADIGLLVNVWGPIHISGMAELKLELSNLMHREIISSLAKSMINHPWKGRGLAHVNHFCMRNCGLTKNFVTTRR